MPRLFIAIDLPAAQRQAAAAACAEVRGVRLTRTHQLHLTLRFLGATPEERLPLVRERLARVAVAPFDLALHGAGTFPPRGSRPTVLWLGVAPLEPLARLKREIDHVLEAPPAPLLAEPSSTFRPHLTLARCKGRPDASLTRFLREHASFRGDTWRVESFRLYQSTLGADRAVHEALATYPLRGICREG